MRVTQCWLVSNLIENPEARSITADVRSFPFQAAASSYPATRRRLAELEAAGAKSAKVGNDEMSDRVRWIRSYVVKEPDGRFGTVCVYQARDPQSIREHARRVGMPADQIFPVVATIVVRDDPKEATEAA